MARDFSKVKRIVVKIGSSSLTYNATHKLNIDRIDRLAKEISDISNSGVEVVLVSSGAIATGMARLKFDSKPQELSKKQALACVGQSNLMEIYNKCFADYGYTVGQLLLTKYVIDNKQMRVNAENCINEMLKLGVIPIINENDSISVEEIKLGDNDNLSSIVARLVKADLLILLSDIDGLYTKDPNKYADAQMITQVDNIKELCIDKSESKSSLGTGGISTKLKACEDATNAGIDCIIANGGNIHAIKQILSNKEVGTLFKAHKHKQSSQENERTL
ncbi:MAG: glutamate 5-kinase [Christensenellales bacterium]